MNEKLVTLLDDSFAEFDRLMTKTLEEFNLCQELWADYDVLVGRQEALRLAAASFIGEAAMAVADLDGRLPRLTTAPRVAA